jgi:hypothetical protein
MEKIIHYVAAQPGTHVKGQWPESGKHEMLLVVAWGIEEGENVAMPIFAAPQFSIEGPLDPDTSIEEPDDTSKDIGVTVS